MNLKLLHLNVEQGKHTATVNALIEREQPEVLSFAEVLENEARTITEKFGYHYVYSPLLILADGQPMGSAIFSKYPILSTSTERYNDGESDEIPRVRTENTAVERPKDRFTHHYAVLSADIEKEGKKITVATTHFPVVDHSGRDSKGENLGDHILESEEQVQEIVYSEKYFEKFLTIIKSLPHPLVFTADMNNARGEYIFDTLAHELVDRTPKDITSSLDPILHRRPLEIVVDCIMTSPDVSTPLTQVIEGVSDHKGYLSTVIY